ncbi:hypothetical protein B0H14DRAFT_3869383 [Mycena olivaceomarginata]|nr:hypothetical protein B0H14DRAFT_3869383 [Mycena olivaceomarginata]
MLPPKFFGTLTTVAHLPPLILADWSPGKAAQINFYVNGTCAPQYIYSSAATSWWSVSPLVGIGSITGAECFTLNLVGGSTGINTGMMWEQSPPKDGIEPNQANGSFRRFDSEYNNASAVLDWGYGSDSDFVFHDPTHNTNIAISSLPHDLVAPHPP